MVFISMGALLGWFVYTLARETISLASNIEEFLDYFDRSIVLMLNSLTWLLNFLPGDTESVVTEIINAFLQWIQDSSLAIADYAIANTVPLTTRLGSGIISIVVFIMAAYFITADYAHLAARLRSLIGARVYGGYNAVLQT